MQELDTDPDMHLDYSTFGKVTLKYDFYAEARYGSLTVPMDEESALKEIMDIIKARNDRLIVYGETIRAVDESRRNGTDLGGYPSDYAEVYEYEIGKKWKKGDAKDETIANLQSEVSRLCGIIANLRAQVAIAKPKRTRRTKAA